VTQSVIARVAALKTTPTPELKELWKQLFDAKPPPYNRRFLESRLAYRIQELAYGGLKRETVARLEAIARAVEADEPEKIKGRRVMDRPIAGTRLIRQWRGVEYVVTVRDDGYEYQGRMYKGLSPIANAITGSRWNGLIFFGLKNQRKKP
jgi:hypothetical protein